MKAKSPPKEFFCPVETCKRRPSPFKRKDNMVRHVRKQHPGNTRALVAATGTPEQQGSGEEHIPVIIGVVEEVDDDDEDEDEGWN
jgi:hypothetical protein